MQKRELRSRLLARRQSLSDATRAAASRSLCTHLRAWILRHDLRQVALFTPHRGEPDLLALADLHATVTLALPVVTDGAAATMHFHVWNPGARLSPNQWGILEPDPAATPVLDLRAARTAVVLPAVALDRGGGRLGYGGGFYDRLLAEHGQHVETVGAAFEEFVLEHLPKEAHDHAVRWLATEAGVVRV